MNRSLILIGRGFAVIFIAASFRATGAGLPTKQDDRLLPVYHTNRVWNAITTTTDGRVFVGFPGADRPGIEVEEMDAPGHGHPYPSAQWNSWEPGRPAAKSFVHVNALRIGLMVTSGSSTQARRASASRLCLEAREPFVSI